LPSSGLSESSLVGVDDGSIVQPVQAHCVRLDNIGDLDTLSCNEQGDFDDGESEFS
jgi:hypothetical protein